MPLARYKNLAAERKDAILRAAAHEFAEKGYERASLNRMIKEAGLSKGTFYYYFEDKADLFVTVLRVKLPWEAWSEEAGLMETSDLVTFWEAFKALEVRKYAYLGEYPDIARLAKALGTLTDSHYENASLKDYLDDRGAGLRGVLGHGRRVGAIRSDVPMQLLLSLSEGIGRSLNEWIFEDWDVLSQVERTERGEVALETIRRVLSVSGGEALG